jgi:hypothetical protein
MGYSIFPQAGASSIPALQHTVNSSQTITTNNSGGFVGYAMAIGGGQGGSPGSPNANNSGYGGSGGAGAPLMMSPIASASADVVVLVGAGGNTGGGLGGTSEVATLKAFGGSNALANATYTGSTLIPQGSTGGNGSGGDSGAINTNGNVGVSRGGSTQFAAAGGGGGGGGWTWAYNTAATSGGTGSPFTGNGGAGGATKSAGSAGNVPGGGGGGGGSAQYQNPGAGAGGVGAQGRVWIFY